MALSPNVHRKYGFTSGSSVTHFEPGGGNLNSLGTWACLVYPETPKEEGTSDSFMRTETKAEVTTNGFQLRMMFDGTLQLQSSSFGKLSVNTWYLIVVSKESGTVKPKFYVYNFSTKEWTIAEGSATVANVSLENGYMRIGANSRFKIAAAATWKKVLTEAEAKYLISVGGIEGWLDKSPTQMWMWNQEKTSEAVTDITGNGAAQFSQTTTNMAVVEEAPPLPYAKPTKTEYNDSVTGTVTLSGSKKETWGHNNTRSGTETLSGSKKETWGFSDKRSGTVTLSGSVVESSKLGYSDSPSGTITLSGSVVESWQRIFTDSRSGTITSSGSRSESFSSDDKRSGQITLSGSVVESSKRVFTDSCSGSLAISGSVVEKWQKIFTDSRSGTVTLSGSKKESKGFGEKRSGTITLSGTIVESVTVEGYVRKFQSSKKDWIRTSIGESALTGDATIAGVVWLSNNNNGTVLGYLPEAGQRYWLGFTGTKFLQFYKQEGSDGPSIEGQYERWLFVAGTKSAGTNKPKIYLYDYSTKTWEIAEGSKALTNASSGATKVQFGQWNEEANNLLDGYLQAAAVWNKVLTEAEIKELVSGETIDKWLTKSPKGLWKFGQSAATTSITDATGHGANQVERSGTEAVKKVLPIRYSDKTYYEDSPSGTLTLSGSSKETHGFSDKPSGPTSISGTTKESSSDLDIHTGNITLVGSKSESYEHKDSASGTVTVSGSNKDANGWHDHSSGTVSLSGSVVEKYIFGNEDEPAGEIALSGTRKESLEFKDFPSGSLTSSGSAKETGGWIDSESGSLTLSGTIVETWGFSDVVKGSETLAGEHEDGWEKSDTRTGTIKLVGEKRESKGPTDTAEGTVSLSGSLIEQIGKADSCLGELTLSGTNKDSKQTAYIDQAFGGWTLSGSVKEKYSVEHKVKGSLTISGTKVEVFNFREQLADPPSVLELQTRTTMLSLDPHQTSLTTDSFVKTLSTNGPTTDLELDNG